MDEEREPGTGRFPYTVRGLLPDGRAVHFRPIRPEDGIKLRAAFARLSFGSRYRRFSAAISDLSDDEVEYLTDIDHDRHEAWVAVVFEGAEEVGIGVARYVRDHNVRTEAEVAVTVIDEYQRHRVGTILLWLIARSAALHGL